MLKIKERLLPRLTEYICEGCYLEFYLPTNVAKKVLTCPLCLRRGFVNGDIVMAEYSEVQPKKDTNVKSPEVIAEQSAEQWRT